MRTIKTILKSGLMLAVLILTISIFNATATTFTVTNTNDSGTGSLRDAIAQAGANGTEDTINFDPAFFNTPRTITLTTGEFLINSDGGTTIILGRKLTINGPGANLLTITGGNASRIFFVNTGSFVAMSGMTLRDGNGVGRVLNNEGVSGGAIIAHVGDLTLTNMVVRNNSVIASGGAIYLSGIKNFTMTDSQVTENFAVVYAGGIYAPLTQGAITFRNTTISNNSTDNQVGGLAIANGTTTIENCLISGNRSGLQPLGTNDVGGLILFQTRATVTDTAISNNTAGTPPSGGNEGNVGSYGGVYADASTSTPIVFRRVTVSGNRSFGQNAGGMYLRTGGGNITVIDSTVSGNQANKPLFGSFSIGGGIHVPNSSGRVNIINTTVAGNVANGGMGGGIANFTNELRVINSTITNNSATGGTGTDLTGGGGILNATSYGGVTRLQNTIVANNAAGAANGNFGPDIAGTFVSNGYNIIGNTANSTGFGTAGDKLNTNPLLGTLQNNGGATQTIALQPNSPAINAGNNSLAVNHNGDLLPFDQRGNCFERFVGGTVDIGAFEVGATSGCNPSRFDFDGDGRDDVSVFRPSNGAWYLQQSSNGFTGITFGVSTDLIVPADYDGDGRTDVAVFRPSTGIWYLQRSSLGFTGIPFGQAGDIPQPGDYDGDGKADVAVFRPSNGAWYIQRSSLGFTGIPFGTNGDRPAAADYDGDGKTDVAVNRGGIWYIQQSTLGFTGIQFGDGNDKPVPADYDGDGKADVAVFRPSNGAWYLQRSQLGFTGVTFGLSGDVPVPADYDGDGKADVSVFRSGTWYLNRSTQGFTGVSFGAATDKPAPNAFVP